MQNPMKIQEEQIKSDFGEDEKIDLLDIHKKY